MFLLLVFHNIVSVKNVSFRTLQEKGGWWMVDGGNILSLTHFAADIAGEAFIVVFLRREVSC